MMILSKFIGTKIINMIMTNNNKWITTELNDFSITWVDLDGSFYDGRFRVKNKYLQIKEFLPFYNMTLEELHKITSPPEKTRCVILGTTEFLFPYVAYCLKFVEKNQYIMEDTPFIIYAPCEWNLIDNISMIDYISNFYKSKTYKIIIFLPKDNNKWFTADNLEPRITIMEMYRLFLNLGDININVEEDADKYKITIV